MPIAKKTASGSWTCLVDIGMVEGKRKQKRITVNDPSWEGKKKCERLASEYAAQRRTSPSATVSDCVRDYISSKEKILSPNTLCGYKQLQRNAYGEIDDRDAETLSQTDLQEWMSDFAETHSAKSCRNAKGLLFAALSAKYPDVRYHVTVPQSKPYEYYTPTDEDVQTLLRESDGELHKAILLAAFGTLRRGEICALTAADISGNAVHVRRSVATVPDGGYVTKAPKTPSSVRTVPLPPSVIAQLTPTNGKIVDLTLKGLSKRFDTLLRKCGLHQFRFHDLRAYSISARHAIGIPDQYTIGSSGHSTDSVMKRVYRREMEDKKKEFDQKANDYFANVLKQSKKSHKKVTSQSQSHKKSHS